MSQLSVTDAALEGFRIPREQPRALLWWIGFQILTSLVTGLGVLLVAPDAMRALQTPIDLANPNASLDMMRRVMPIYTVILPIGLLVQSVSCAAIYRIVLGRGDARFGYMRLGADELRLSILSFIYIGVAFFAVFGVTLAASAISMLGRGLPAGIGILVSLAAYVAGLACLLALAIRLSLAPVQTFAEKRVAVFDSWSLTKGRFWQMFVIYAVAFAAFVLVFILMLLAASMALGALSGGRVAETIQGFSDDLGRLETFFRPGALAYLAVSAAIKTLVYTIVIAPAAVIYRQLARPGATDVFA
jgi:hypothetical protein